MADALIDPFMALVAGSALGIAGVDAARRIHRVYSRLTHRD